MQLDQERLRRIEGRKLARFYPERGPLRRELYKRHLLFFELGARLTSRAFMAANRIGKTEGAGGYELTLHLTGRYPEWWKGARFNSRIRAWASGDTSKTVRDIIQQKLLGDWGQFGTGLIPREDIIRWTSKQGTSEAVDTVWVWHYDEKGKRDGKSRLSFKSYDQKRQAFQGTEQDVIWLDEESDEGIRNECLLRLMTTDGLLMETFTPLKGITPVVMQYLPSGYSEDARDVVEGDKALVMAGWDDVPHLTEKQKASILAETPPYLRKARSKGIPSLGAGAIYPIDWEEISVDTFPIPHYWPRGYVLDVGWKRTAALWGALNPDTRQIFLYAEHYRGEAEPPIHAAAIKTQGDDLPGIVDPAARGRGQDDGKRLLTSYRALGLKLTPAPSNAFEIGLTEVWQALSTGKIKVMKHLSAFRTEYQMYRRDEKGKVVKENDHLMDDLRYMVLSRMSYFRVPGMKRPTVPVWVPYDPGMGA